MSIASHHFNSNAAGTLADRVVGLVYPRDGRLRARKVVSRSKARGTGKYPSWKMQRMLQWESPHELNAFRLLDADPNVTAFREQPVTVSYVQDGEKRTHYPDIEVVYSGHKQLWEVKSARDAEEPDVMHRTRLMEAALPHFGYTYRVVVAETLTANCRLANAIELLRRGRADVSPLEREHARRIFEKRDISWREINTGLLGPKGKALVCRLVLEGVLSIDTDKPIRCDSLVSLAAKYAEAAAHRHIGEAA